MRHSVRLPMAPDQRGLQCRSLVACQNASVNGCGLHTQKSTGTSRFLAQKLCRVHLCGPFGCDAGKRIKGRKRHLLVDTLGLVLGVGLTPADTNDRNGSQALLRRVLAWLIRTRLLWVDGGYSGSAFLNWVKTRRRKLT